MDLGLSIAGGGGGGGELSKRSESIGQETNHPSLQLELKLPWPNELEINRKVAGSSCHLATMAVAAAAATTTQGGFDAIRVLNPMSDRDNETGPSSSTTSRSTTAERACWRCSDDEEDGGAGDGRAPRKKLRLTKEQSCYLEESFKEQTTLNPKQKLAIAKKLNLQTRQIEVWFQNRRARTKLKQTELDYEYLKRCCKSLTEENRRLHRELQELKALKSPRHSGHFSVHLPPAAATTLTMCPSCDRASPSAAKEATGKQISSFGSLPLKLRDSYPKLAYQQVS